MRLYIIRSLLFLFVIPVLPMKQIYNANENKQMFDIAYNNLKYFIRAIPLNDAELYGFKDKGEFDSVYLGEPIYLYAIDENKLQKIKTNKIDSVIIISDEIIFPVLSKGEYKSVLTIKKIDGQWKAISFGSRHLAIELKKIRDCWVGHGVKIIKLYKANKYYFTIPELGGSNLTEIDLSNGTNTDYTKTSDMKQVFNN
ncbi:MAG: hypothetical protein A2268_05115 [Candidatus Raymondbacteria bacterium RifOxyA12_full_50_37]|uniref:Uncharacterized protein n=1 Tax=Candidatus Raymondbacteria bacterium RIFOXYD12_FULL_49_13 TaxID=1817890 RepID=A0A1F7FDE9_UNCRA|nr:MAG: hypothetical protein A2248_10145 [Candidatus Raymondbacteria bacterium RIFOXYA2_FULL_49_16]OGJ88146.1 MAG: hypothetical protein A2268_05115 [Candidatus Raymondbacteria bacterium RifOxyA12_full_50_37]OGJ93643.1 MAG: hypothetical protein A2350_06640 [Candidatus Raymondbacteria bacterium RifOxyB12_full_50_8]OGJ96948.1 MAG: hypothetical protein A2453_04920 [Candidatus Raymondbacteria bacterium RIFOXYC2_FULL_50_21]OGK04673.1 MAG: hypothetical protein A2519_21090 [Candidatus Raymondbacteria b